LTVNWQDHLGEQQGRALPQPRRDHARSRKPFKKNTGIAVLRGNLCPGGAIIKPSAATPKLMKHRGRAVVFENIEDFHKRIDDPKLGHRREMRHGAQELRPQGLSRAWPKSATCRCRRSSAERAVTDMVRISDARMSGTAYGTVILHMVPEAAAAACSRWCRTATYRTGRSQAESRTKDFPEGNCEEKKAWKKPKSPLPRGYWKLYFRSRAAGRPGRGPRLPRRQERCVRAARQPLGAR
jgi:dihydroxy-acid dehydratase